MLESIDLVIQYFEDILSTKKKRHIVGGILISASVFFGSLAITVATIKNGGEENE